MQLRPEQLSTHLEKPLAPLYVLHGDDPLLVAEAGDAIRAAARRQGYEEREVLVAGQGFRWDALHLAAGSMSLFGGSKLVDLRIPNGKPGKDGAEALQRLLGTPGGGITTLITLPQLDWATRKAAWFVALAKDGVVIEANAPERDQLPAWIAMRLARQQQSAPTEALTFIAEHVEGNLLAAHQELQKLALLHPPGELSLPQVEAAVLNVARYDIDGLRKALLEGDLNRCIRLLDGLEGEGIAPPLILWAVTTEIRTLYNLRIGMDRGQPIAGLMKAERVFDDRRRTLLQRALPRLSAGRLRAALMQAARLDRMIKGLQPGDQWQAFQQLLMRLLDRPARKA